MTQTISKIGLFHTPDSMDALHAYIEGLSGSEKALAYTIMGMTWNLCAELTKENDEEDS